MALVIPIFIETLLIMMLGAVDTIMLSRFSDDSVAAVGVVNQLIMFTFLLFEVINIGTSVLCSQYIGAGHRDKVVQVVGVSLIVNIIFGLNIPIAKEVLTGGVIDPLALTYFRVVGAALVFWFASIFVKSEKLTKKDFLMLFLGYFF